MCCVFVQGYVGIAWVGDCRAVLVKPLQTTESQKSLASEEVVDDKDPKVFQGIPLTNDHSPMVWEERMRIQKGIAFLSNFLLSLGKLQCFWVLTIFVFHIYTAGGLVKDGRVNGSLEVRPLLRNVFKVPIPWGILCRSFPLLFAIFP